LYWSTQRKTKIAFEGKYIIMSEFLHFCLSSFICSCHFTFYTGMFCRTIVLFCYVGSFFHCFVFFQLCLIMSTNQQLQRLSVQELHIANRARNQWRDMINEHARKQNKQIKLNLQSLCKPLYKMTSKVWITIYIL